MAGVTSARDLGAPLEESIAVRDAINNGEIPGATLYVSGPFIQHNPYPGTEDFRWGLMEQRMVEKKIRKLAKAGVDVIKLIDQDQMTLEELKAVVDEAHKNNLKVVAHGHRPEEIRRGLLVDVDCFEHTGLSSAPAILRCNGNDQRTNSSNEIRVPYFGVQRLKDCTTTNMYVIIGKTG